MSLNTKKHFRLSVLKLPLEKFIPVAFLIFLLLFVILTIIIYNNINTYRENVSAVNHTYQVMGTIDDINLTLTQMQLNRRGYIVKGDNRYLSEYYNNRNSLKDKFIRLESLVRDNAVQFVRIRSIDSLSKSSISFLDSSIQHYDSSKSLFREVQTAFSMNSQAYLDSVFFIAKDMKDEEISLLNKRQEKANINLENTQLFIIFTSFFVFVVLGLSLYISNKLIRNKNQAEEMLRESYENLEYKVEERTHDLKKVNENLVTEINNRILVENSLRESEERFRNMADSSPVFIWMSDKSKGHYYFSKGWLDFTGRTLEEQFNNGWMESLHPEDAERFRNVYLPAFDKREPFEIEYRLKNTNGDYIWFLDKGIPRYEGSEFMGYIGTCFDIHLRKRNERYVRIQYAISRTLTESASEEQALYNVMKNICTELDWDFGILWQVNGEKIKPEAIWGKSKNEFSEYSNLYEKNFTLEKGIGLPGKVWKSGKSLWVEDIGKDAGFVRKEDAINMGWNSAFAVPITNGKETIAIIECFNKKSLSPKQDLLDVLESVGSQVGNYLERIKAEELLKESHLDLESKVKERTIELANTLNRLLTEIEQKEKIQNKLKLFSHAIKGIKECVYITDLENNILFVNAAFEEVFGYYEEELTGNKIPLLFSSAINDDIKSDILFQSIKGGWKGELRTIRKDGTEIDIYLSKSAIRNDEGKIEALIGICQDITESLKQKELLVKRNGLLKLLNDVIAVTNRSFNIDASVSYSINKMCEYINWDIGHCYYAAGDKLVSSGVWNGNLSEKYLEFRNYTEKSVFNKGEGLPGRCFETGKSEWVKIESLINEKLYKRAAITKKAGLQTGVWAPIKAGTKVVGVLEFFNKDEKEIDNEVLESINNIGIELGSLLERIEIISKVRESEENLRLLIESIKDYAIIKLDVNGNISSWNKGAQEIKGYTADEIIGKHFSTFYTPEEIEANEPQENLENAVKLGKFERVGWRVKKDGSLFLADIIFNPLYDENSQLIGYVKVTRDITESKKAQDALIESEKQLREAQRIAKIGSWSRDMQKDEVSWSEEMYRIFEVPFGTKITLANYLKMIGDENKPVREKEINQSIEAGKPFNYYLKITTPSGNEKILNSIGDVERDSNGNIIRMLGTVMDVTEIKQAEEKIKSSEKQLKAAQKITKLGSWEVDLMSGEIVWSEEMFRIYDIPLNDEPHTYDQLKHLIHPDDVDKVEKLNEQLAVHPIETDIDYRIITNEGRLKYLDTVIRVETDENNTPLKLFGSVQDITELKIVEEELRMTNARLIEAQKELVHNEKLAALGRFSSGIAHEIRNPLANISALAQLLSRSKIEDEKMKKHLKYILVNADIANKIIKDLLHFASPEDLVFKTENMAEVLEEIVNSAESRCIENKIDIVKNINIDDAEMDIDKSRLENALLNFISNSIDSMQSGGILTVNADSNNITREITIKIIDTGSGISPENLDKIFEPFFTTKETGTGLGLGLAYQTIKLHQGILNISSEPGKGTMVEIKLPIRKSLSNINTSNGKNSNSR